MTVEIICVGTEILLGNIVNTNAAYLAGKCADLGLVNYYQSVVGDNAERLTESLKLAAGRSDIVILSGGLGPTEDDLTKEVAAEFAGKALVMNEECRDRIRTYFEARKMDISENNWKQAMIPEDAVIFQNNNGTAPGMAIETEMVKMILLPGPPNELIPMFEESVVPYLKQFTPGVIDCEDLRCFREPGGNYVEGSD